MTTRVVRSFTIIVLGLVLPAVAVASRVATGSTRNAIVHEAELRALTGIPERCLYARVTTKDGGNWAEVSFNGNSGHSCARWVFNGVVILRRTRIAGLPWDYVTSGSAMIQCGRSSTFIGIPLAVQQDLHLPCAGTPPTGPAMGVTSASAATIVNTYHGSGPDGVSSDGTHVWVANSGGGTVTEIGASTGKVVRTIKVGYVPNGVSSDGTHVWVTNGGAENGDTVSEIEASTGKVVRTIKVGRAPGAVSSDGTHVWVTNGLSPGTVTEIDASTGTVVNTIQVGGGPSGVSSDGTHVWVAQEAGTVTEIDAATGTVVNTIKVGKGSQGVSSDGTHVWVTNRGTGLNPGDTVSEIDASTGTVVNTIKVGRAPLGVSSDGTHAWVANNVSGTVTEIDASTGTVVNTIKVAGFGRGPNWVSSDGTHVWVANGILDRITEIRIK